MVTHCWTRCCLRGRRRPRQKSWSALLCSAKSGPTRCAALRTPRGDTRVTYVRGWQARWALYAGVSLHYGSTAERASSVASALSAAATAGPVDDELCALVQQHAGAAASAVQLRSSLQAALASAQLATAVEQGGALLHSGRFGAAAACVAAVDAAAMTLRAAGDESSALLAYNELCESLADALRSALQQRVSFQLSGDACSGNVHVRTGPEPLAAVWEGAAALQCAAQSVRELAAAAAPSAHAAVFCHSYARARRHSDAAGDALAWQASTEGDAATPLLAFLGEAALCADERVRHAFGAALCAAVGAAAVARVRAVDGRASDADWAAQLERASAFERAAAQQNMLANATCPISAALCAAHADERAAVRGKQLALARGLALDTSHGATLVAGAWSGRVSDMVDGAVPSLPPGHGVACFPACVVSGTALALASLLAERLRAGAYSDAIDAADMLRACVPCMQADELAAAPGSAMQFRNSAHFLAFVLRNGAAATRAPALLGAAAALCSAGEAVLVTAVSRAGSDAAAALDLADGFNKAGEADRGAAVERALTGALHAVRRFHALACKTLPCAVADSTSRVVLHAVGARAADEILALPDIGVDDCSALASAFDAACAAVGVPALDSLGWRRFARLRALLDMPLASIVAEAERGEMRGVLSVAEVESLVCAVFTDSALRTDARARIAAINE